MVRSQNGGDGIEKGRSLREKREERREKREQRDKHDQDERVEGGNGSVPGWRDGTEKGRSLREKREESREKREERGEKRETSTTKISMWTDAMRGSKEAMVWSQTGGMVQKRVGP